ncbi:AhpC/TSA family protein [Paenibacillus sp. F411]|uniref:thioredoxin-dependent peroxiredoxin n=1 Tax=Paenibacillus algicola TaxID=2565926 RepID=A0A4P8XFC2_9BACL|nr:MULTISPECIES: peroxiredoxin-like family protein [Paenibacillus]MBO2944338.1 AhpC/TSA family protein [Paenibacillus sp. F411]QCT01107.1 alkyl hydroperoxide reductase/ Thiol specific antioxidant/ Mal allergen [Paenibacillus algicola]
MDLTAELTKAREGFMANAPQEVLDSVEAATKELIESGVATGLQVGEEAPDFVLPNAAGNQVSLYKQLEKGPVVLTFYRGGWCPYCNLELKAYQNVLPELQAAGASLMAISPQKPDASLSTKEKNELSFEVLSDDTYEVIKAYNLYFTLPDQLIRTYSDKFNIQLSEYNGTDEPWSLPVPGTFVINTDRKVVLASSNANYTERLNPAEVVSFLNNHK